MSVRVPDGVVGFPCQGVSIPLVNFCTAKLKQLHTVIYSYAVYVFHVVVSIIM